MDALELLRKMVGIRSIFPHEGALGEFVEEYLKAHGFHVQRQIISHDPPRFNVLAHKGTAKRSLLLYGHLDTVPVYGSWTSDPFTLVERGENLMGLGAFDMKSGCAALLKAAEDVSLRNFTLKLAFGCDEENISEGAWTLSRDPFLRDVCCVFVAEPGTSARHHGGAHVLTLGRRGRCDLLVTVQGVSAHGAYGLGVNAITEAATLVRELAKIRLAQHQELGLASLFVKHIHADPGSLSVPERCELVIDRHLVPPETVTSAVDDIQQLVATMKQHGLLEKATTVSVAAKQRKTPYLQPYATEREHPFVRCAARTVQELFGDVVYNYGLSVADDNIFGHDLHLPVITLGAAGGNAHAANEFVNRKSFFDLIRVYTSLLQRIDTSL